MDVVGWGEEGGAIWGDLGRAGVITVEEMEAFGCLGDGGDFVGGVGFEVDFVVDEGWGTGGVGMEAEEPRVGAGAEGDDLFFGGRGGGGGGGGGGGEEEAVDEGVDCFGADVGA